MAGYKVSGRFVAEVPGASSARDAIDIVTGGLTVEGFVHGQRVTEVNDVDAWDVP